MDEILNLDWDLYPDNETGIYDDETGYLQTIKDSVEQRIIDENQ